MSNPMFGLTRDELLASAKSYSDTYCSVISRIPDRYFSEIRSPNFFSFIHLGQTDVGGIHELLEIYSDRKSMLLQTDSFSNTVTGELKLNIILSFSDRHDIRLAVWHIDNVENIAQLVKELTDDSQFLHRDKYGIYSIKQTHEQS